MAAVILDGIPENMALGVTLLQTSSTGALALLAAIFASNLPEALGGAVSMRDQGRSRAFAVAVWTASSLRCSMTSWTAADRITTNSALCSSGASPASFVPSVPASDCVSWLAHVGQV